MRMNVGEEFEFNGILLRVEREMSDFSCEGCFFKYIRVFEAGLSAEQYGDYEQSTGNAAQEKESNRLIAIAKAQDRESLLLW